MFRSLYSRLLALFLAVLIVAMGTLTFFMYDRIREDKVNERLTELTNQARDVRSWPRSAACILRAAPIST